MKKKIRLLLCILMATLCFVGCSDASEKKLTDSDKELLEKQCELVFQLCTEDPVIAQDSVTGKTQTVTQYMEKASEFEMNQLIAYFGLDVTPENFKKMFSSFDAAIEECGELEDWGKFKTSEDGTQVSVNAKFKNKDKDREATIIFSFDEKQIMESMDVSAHYSTGEIMGKAGMNTLLGMGTVFAVLIFLAFLIYLMKYISVVSDWFKGTTKKKETEPKEIPTNEDSVVDDVTDDFELVAVIAAAIAAAEGTSTDKFVVRSIRRRPSNNWN